MGINSPNAHGISKLRPDAGLYGSPVQKLFNQNKESVEEMLVRKFRTKYIDSNPLF